MVELVDTRDLKSLAQLGMRVRVPLQVPFDLLQFEALDLAVQGAGGDTGRSNKKLTVSDALVIAKLCRE